MPDLFNNAMHPIDWLIIAGYFVLIIAIGALASRGGADDGQGYFLGNRRMPAWAVAMSFAATALSAATFIGGPEYSYRQDLTLLADELSKLVAAVFVALVFLPAIYRSGSATVYGYLGQHIGPGAATAASIVFLFGRLLASGSRLFIAGIAFSLILYDRLDTNSLITAILVFGVVGTLYTAMGGIKAVIWTDTLQLLIVVGAVVAAMVLLVRAIPMPLGEIVDVLQASGKTRVIETSTDLTKNNTLLAAAAMTVFYAAAFGADQDMAQRLLTCKTLGQSMRSLLSAIIIAMPITLLFMLTGLLLYIFYSRPDLMGDAAPTYAIDDPRKVYTKYLLHELPTGVRGLALAGLFAAAMSSLDSTINAMASSVVADLIRPKRDSARINRAAVIGMGVLLTLAAVGMVFVYNPEKDSLIKFALGVMTFAYAGLMGVFLCVVLTGRGSTVSVIAALATGLTVIACSRYVPVLAGYGLAFPYWMLIGTAASLGVCVMGRRVRVLQV